MKTILLPQEKTLPPGDYYVGDPCYVYPDAEWGALVNQMFEAVPNTGYQGVYETDGIKWACFSTRYGDGSYSARQNGRKVGECPVDAGCIACIPMSLIKTWGADPTNGVVVLLPRDNKVSCSEAGTIKYGSVTIKTS